MTTFAMQHRVKILKQKKFFATCAIGSVWNCVNRIKWSIASVAVVAVSENSEEDTLDETRLRKRGDREPAPTYVTKT